MSSPLSLIQNWQELAKLAKWSASALAKQCNVSVRTLHRHFIKHLGQNPKTWLEEQRLHTADKLLCDGSSVKEAADRVGYKQQSSLTRHYKSKTGICPSQQSPANESNPKLSANDKQLISNVRKC